MRGKRDPLFCTQFVKPISQPHSKQEKERVRVCVCGRTLCQQVVAGGGAGSAEEEGGRGGLHDHDNESSSKTLLTKNASAARPPKKQTSNHCPLEMFASLLTVFGIGLRCSRNLRPDTLL